jgi:hypothetical protein
LEGVFVVVGSVCGLRRVDRRVDPAGWNDGWRSGWSFLEVQAAEGYSTPGGRSWSTPLLDSRRQLGLSRFDWILEGAVFLTASTRLRRSSAFAQIGFHWSPTSGARETLYAILHEEDRI